MNVLISAYACEPDKGSEPAAGWNWAVAAGRNHRVTVLTRGNNRASIESATDRGDLKSVRFEYVDLPKWASWWKRGQLGVRTYYVLWQFAASRRARELHSTEPFDLCHHVTLANIWLPARVRLEGVPMILGPVGEGRECL